MTETPTLMMKQRNCYLIIKNKTIKNGKLSRNNKA